MEKVTVSEVWHPAGFLLRVEKIPKPDWHVENISGDDGGMSSELQNVLDEAPETMPMESAYTLNGEYIGSVETAKMICGRGIAPELSKPTNGVCSIGFCEADQKWFGWSHRAICGFGVGSEVVKGDCAYVPSNWDDFLADAARFWTEEFHENVTSRRSVDADGRPIARVEWTGSQSIPNEKMRGVVSGANMYPPDQWGRGEWTAESLEDAKQMAIDFAESVS